MTRIAVDFLAAEGILSRSIEMFGFPRGYSHSASVIVDPVHGERYIDARTDVIGGVPPGVQIRDPTKYKWLRKRRATLEVTPEEAASRESNLRAKITTDYDLDAILGFLEGRSIHTAGRWICSALMINAEQHISRQWAPGHLGFIPFPLIIPAHEISPDVGILLLQTSGWTIGEEIAA